MGSAVRYHRRKSGLTQRDIAEVLATISDKQVAKHEHARSLPSLLSAIGYQIIFRVSIAELFPDIYETVRQSVEERLAALERRLQDNTATGGKAEVIARKLIWLEERRNNDTLTLA